MTFGNNEWIETYRVQPPHHVKVQPLPVQQPTQQPSQQTAQEIAIKYVDQYGNPYDKHLIVYGDILCEITNKLCYVNI